MKKICLSLMALLITTLYSAQNGTIDLSFSMDGQYGFMPLPNDVITTRIIEVNTKIFAVLTSVNGGSDAFILKMNEDGSNDNTFGVNGLLTLPNRILDDAALSYEGNALLLIGSTSGIQQIAKYSLTGSVLQDWGTVPNPNGGGFSKLKLDSQGHIYLGSGYYSNGFNYGSVIRLLDNFQLDTSFGNAGIGVTTESGFQYPLMEIDHLDRIVLGHSGPQGSNIWRFNTDGSLDASFDYNINFANYSLSNWILDIAIAADNSIYVQPNTYAYPNAVFKLNADGSLDTSFGTSGYLSFNDTDPNQFAVPDELLAEPNGGLIIMGTAFDISSYMSGKYLLRLDENGNVDASFTSTIQPIDDNNYDLLINFHCATLQQDGKVLSMDQVAKWQNGQLLGYAPLITRFRNDEGAVTSNVLDAGIVANDLVVYPNPTHDFIYFKQNTNDMLHQNLMLTIYNSMGQAVMHERMSGNPINIASLAAGHYQCIAQGKNEVYKLQFMKD